MSDLEDNSWPAFRLDSEITFQLASELDFPSKKGDNDEQRWFYAMILVTAVRTVHACMAHAS